MKLGTLIAACLATVVFAGSAGAQSAADYPSKPIKIIGPFAAGRSGDIMSRMIADHLQKKWGQSVIVENQPGGGSLVGAQNVKRSAPDGYTIMLGYDSLAMFNIFLKNPDIDTQKELTPISYFSRYPLVMLSSAKQPYKNLKELIAYAKANPGKVNFAMQTNAPVHLFGAMVASKAGINWQMIPYTAAAALNQSLLADESHVTLTLYSALSGAIGEGKIRALGVFSDQRTPLAPGVPTMKEQGMDVSATIWYGIFGPAGIPRPIVDKLSKAIQDMVKEPAVIEQAKKMNMELVGSTPEVLAKTLADDLRLRAEAGKIANIQKE